MTAKYDTILCGVPEGLDALVLTNLVHEAAGDAGAGLHLHVARDDRRAEEIANALKFFAPKVKVIAFPAWDTVPYDRVGPNTDIVAKRITALAKLAHGGRKEPAIVLTTVNAVLQKVPPRLFIKNAMKIMAPGQRIDMGELTRRLSLAGYTRSSTVMEPGEFAVRGGILDLFSPGRQTPVRLDFFGDTIESIKSFDIETQRSLKPVAKVVLMPVSEVAFGEPAIALFRRRYVELFGGATGDDPLYEAVSAGRRFQGQEHWLPFYHEKLETLFDYVPGVKISFDHGAEDVVKARFEQIGEHYEARVEGLESKTFGAEPYKPVPPEQLFLDATSWAGSLRDHSIVRLSAFEQAEGPQVRSMQARKGKTFALERQNPDVNVFDAVVDHIRALQIGKRRVIVVSWTPGARERLSHLLTEHGLRDIRKVESYDEALALPGDVTALGVLGIEEGFETPTLAVIGRRPRRPRHRPVRGFEDDHGARRPA